ncbi:hypothetical protein ASD02_05115 [Ensifer sp. Root1252]|nr:hypothetical protein ASD02_05115 [Ensifer sp. Root1252]KRC67231.1 hypothetical protein ASE32_08575 [Ensifer sp. Root231]KRC98308.1 hypothetical protein ASE47_03765 [Ensifer sp. Root258]
MPGQTHDATKIREIATDFFRAVSLPDKSVPVGSRRSLTSAACRVAATRHLSADATRGFVFGGDRACGPMEQRLPVIKASDRCFVVAVHDHRFAALVVGERLTSFAEKRISQGLINPEIEAILDADGELAISDKIGPSRRSGLCQRDRYPRVLRGYG